MFKLFIYFSFVQHFAAKQTLSLKLGNSCTCRRKEYLKTRNNDNYDNIKIIQASLKMVKK